MQTFLGIFIPFLGTTAGAACVFFMKKSLGDLVQRSLAGFAAGVMVAASIWSLLIPAIEQSSALWESSSFVPAVWRASGSAFCSCWRSTIMIPHLHRRKRARPKARKASLAPHDHDGAGRHAAQHPGGHGGRRRCTRATSPAARRSRRQARWPCPLGIAIQNFPEGAIISMPLRAEGHEEGERVSRAACCPALWSRSARC